MSEVAGETCPCNFHPSGWFRASALTCRLISLVGVKWSCLQIDKQAFPPRKDGRTSNCLLSCIPKSPRTKLAVVVLPCYARKASVPQVSSLQVSNHATHTAIK